MSNDLFNNTPRRQDVSQQTSGVDLSSASMNLSSFRMQPTAELMESSRGTVDIHPKRTVGCDRTPDGDLIGIKLNLPNHNAVIVSGATPKEFANLEKA